MRESRFMSFICILILHIASENLTVRLSVTPAVASIQFFEGGGQNLFPIREGHEAWARAGVGSAGSGVEENLKFGVILDLKIHYRNAL